MAFTASLRATWVRRLLDPAPQPWKRIVWFMLHLHGGSLGQGEAMPVAAISYRGLPGVTDMPSFMVDAFKARGELPTLVVADEATWTFEELLSSPLAFNPAAKYDGYAPSHPGHIAYDRDAEANTRSQQVAVARSLVGRRLAQIRHLMPYVTFRQHGARYVPGTSHSSTRGE